MRKILGCLLLLGLLIGSACKKESAAPADFVKGMVLVGIKDGTATAKAFRLADSLNLPITQMSGFFYRSGLPNDSVAYIKRVLLTKPYLNKKGFTGDAGVRVNAVTKQLEVVDFFFDMDLASQQDWLATMAQLQLSPLGNSTSYMVLQVPEGQEQLWLVRLSSNSLVKWVELNHIGQVQLL